MKEKQGSNEADVDGSRHVLVNTWKITHLIGGLGDVTRAYEFRP